MSETYDLILKGGTVVNHDGIGERDIGVRDGLIATIGTLDPAAAATTVSCTGLHVLPGVIDSQVHFREPGLTHKEDLETGSRAAVLGGVTTVFEMPNTDPQTTTAEALADKIRRASGRMHCDFAFWVGGTRENSADVADLERLPGAAGIKVFMGSSTGSLLVEDDEGVRAILSKARRRVAFHSEDEGMLRELAPLRVAGDVHSHAVWRSAEVALRSTQRLLRIARETGARIHVLHVSTVQEMQELARYKDVATVEVTPHHLTLTAPECYDRLGTYAQMNPPVRDRAHQDGLWWGVANGVVDVLGSDHAPHTREEKDKPYPASPSGMTGVQTLLPIMLDHVNAGRLTLMRLMDLTSAGPARIFGLAGKGRIAVGYDADFALVDLKRQQTITNEGITSRCGWTPYDGVSVKGWTIGTFVRGHHVMRDGEIVASACGFPAKFIQALHV